MKCSPSLGVVVACTGLAGAQPTMSSPLQVTGYLPDTGSTSVMVDPVAYENLKGYGEVIMTDFVLDQDTMVDLRLERRNALADDAIIVAGTPEGDVAVERPDLVMFSGKVMDEPDSHAFIALSPYGQNGYVKIGDETWILSSGPFTEGLPTLIYSLTDLPEGAIDWEEFVCHTDSLENNGLTPITRKPFTGAPRGAPPCRIADVAVDCDWQFWDNLFGQDLGAATAYATLLVTANDDIYQRDANVTLNLVFLRVWTGSGASSDPYNQADIVDQLFQFRDYWEANMGAVDYDGAHMFSARGLGGGVAWVDALCIDDFKYALSANLGGFFPYPIIPNNSQNWDIEVTSHEWGHNFGAPHTHDLVPQVDGCGTGDCTGAANGTIMSYCHLCPGGLANMTLEFHPRNINEQILPYLDNDAPCNLIAGGVGISSHPSSQNACEGDTVMMSVTASGTGPFTYEWRRNGVTIGGATSSTLTLNNVDAGDAGNYTAIVSNDCDSETSNIATLSVDTPCAADLVAPFCQADFFDLLEYLDRFDNEDPSADLVAPFNDWDFFDLLEYLSLFSGC